MITEICKHTGLLLYNYHYPNFIYPKNAIHLPLGFVINFWDKNKKMSERSNDISFVGQLKSDRHNMLENFKNIPNSCIVTAETTWQNMANLAYSPSQLFDLYNDSKFVLNGRGWVSLNCY